VLFVKNHFPASNVSLLLALEVSMFVEIRGANHGATAALGQIVPFLQVWGLRVTSALRVGTVIVLHGAVGNTLGASVGSE